MLKLKKKQAYELMVNYFGPWYSWGRAQHLAYGLARGIHYVKMEKCSNDNPFAVPFEFYLWKLGCFPEHPYIEGKKWYQVPDAVLQEIREHVKWIKKEPRVKKIRDPKEAA